MRQPKLVQNVKIVMSQLKNWPRLTTSKMWKFLNFCAHNVDSNKDKLTLLKRKMILESKYCIKSNTVSMVKDKSFTHKPLKFWSKNSTLTFHILKNLKWQQSEDSSNALLNNSSKNWTITKNKMKYLSQLLKKQKNFFKEDSSH